VRENNENDAMLATRMRHETNG